jgi:hypothetical protein
MQSIFSMHSRRAPACCTMGIIYFLRVLQRPESGGDHPLTCSFALRMGLAYSYASTLQGTGMSRGDLIPVEDVICYDAISCISVSLPIVQNFGKVKCTLVQALKLCTGRTAHKESRGIALIFHNSGTRRG